MVDEDHQSGEDMIPLDDEANKKKKRGRKRICDRIVLNPASK